MTLLDDDAPPDAHRLHRLVSRPARSFHFGPLTGATVLLIGGAGLWVGGAIEETTGLAGGRLAVGDGNAQGINNEFAPLTLLAGQSRFDPPSHPGVVFEGGLVVTATAGTIAGALYVVMLSRPELAFIQAHVQGLGGR